ncbi:MAG: DUF4347 domain-containing protein, partial [Desulfobacterales bacterium]|nr:DUF4347 domain-containing protein [Desulfobacterales bacterium]
MWLHRTRQMRTTAAVDAPTLMRRQTFYSRGYLMLSFSRLKPILKTFFASDTSQSVKDDSTRPGRLMLALESRYLYDASGLTAGLDVLGALPGSAGDSPEAQVVDSGDATDGGTIDLFSPSPLAVDNPDEVVFVDSRVDDYQNLIQDLPEGVQVVTIGADQDGVTLIGQYLAEHQGVATVHILSHGEPGAISLGNTRLSADNIEQAADRLTGWQAGLTENADILLYGCNVAASPAGTGFLERFSALTGADVAASMDPTGSADLGGNWDLEYTRGDIDTPIDYDPLAASYHGLLADPNDAPEINDSSYALSLAGTATDYLIKSNFDSFPTTEITVEMWVKTSDTVNDGSLFSYAVPGQPNEFLLFNYRNLSPEIDATKAGGESGSGVAINDGAWHHVAWTWENTAGTSILYVDGVAVQTASIKAGHTLAASGTLVFGQEQDALGGGFQANQSFNGALDEVRLWNTVRSQADIQGSMNTALNGSETGLVTYWRMNGGSGATITDSVGANDLTVVGTGATWIATPIETTEDHGVVINTLSVADVDAGVSDVQLTLQAANGTLTLSQNTGLSFATGDGSADATMTFTGNLAAINAAINNMTYTPNADFAGTDTLDIHVDDQGFTGDDGAQVADKSINITVTAVNDAPAWTLPGAQTVAEDTDLLFSSGNGNAITVADVDVAETPGNLQVTLSAAHGALTLSQTTGLSFTGGDGAADAAMTFTGTAAAVNAALEGMVYRGDADYNTASGGAETLTITVNDQGNTGAGGALSDTETVGITVSAVNDAPAWTLPGAQTVAEDTDLLFSS